MSDQWEMYMTVVDDQPAVILFDMGIAELSPDRERPTLLTMRLKIVSPDESGFPSDEEEQQLTAVEDSFLDAVEVTVGATFVGRMTSAGYREFYFYAKASENFEETITEAMEKFPDYQFEVGETDDAEWENYFELLYPADEEMQQIFNLRTIDELSEAGDGLTVARSVAHFASFGSTEDRDEFIQSVTELGFRVADRQFDESEDADLPYSVTLRREHAVDLETIDEITFELCERATNLGGQYDGWESPVVNG